MAMTSLFGPTPAQIEEARRIRQEEMIAGEGRELGPFRGLYQAGRRLASTGTQSLVSGLFPEAVDPALREAQAVESIKMKYQGQDFTNPTVLRQMASELGPVAPNAAMNLTKLAQQEEVNQANIAFKNAQAIRMLNPPPGKPVQIDLGDRVELRDPATGRVIETIRKGVTPGQAAKATAKAKPTTEGQKTLDRTFAKEYSDYVANGGSAQVDKILADLDKVESLLESKKTITGIPVRIADAAGALSALYPDAAEAKDLIGGVVQTNLRAILGGQFAQKEGEALLARAYNPAQPQKDNLARVRELKKQVRTAAAARRRAVEYWEENEGTLAGFKGDIKGIGTPKESSRGVPSGVDPAVWNVMTPEEKALWQ
jgi:hypothetical protein